MSRIPSATVYRVTVTEYDRFSGPEMLEVVSFGTRMEAEAYALSYNSRNTAAYAPDCYISAKVEEIRP